MTRAPAAPAPAPAAPGGEAFGRIHSIQALRFLAAAMVVCFHAIAGIRKLYPEHADLAFPAGAAGVDIFFVISGFIITVILERSKPSRGVFILHRVERIVPLYWAMTALMVALAAVMPGAVNATLQGQHVAGSFLFLPVEHPRLHLLLPLLIPGWTLNYEMFFYAVIAVLIHVRLRVRMIVLALVFAALSAAHFFVPELTALSFYTHPIILEFVAGVVIAWFYLNKLQVPAWIANAALVAAIALFGAGIVLNTAETPVRVIFWGVPAALLVFHALFSGTPAWMRSRIVQHLGDASYALYLVHLFVQTAMAFLLLRFGAGAWLPVGLAWVLFVLVSLVAGSAVYQWVEQPLLRLLRSRTRAREPLPAFTASAP